MPEPSNRYRDERTVAAAEPARLRPRTKSSQSLGMGVSGRTGCPVLRPLRSLAGSAAATTSPPMPP
ncbi:hypothetical protein C4K09_0611 [Pseudomonas chlororaphis subsp. aureofaciens]|nr:hypothetical protein C4K09_0611 [Pseudomonas chlororaphis subsp. aureofaciens]